jgi:hypothetical protein
LRLLTSYSPVCFGIVVARHMGNSVVASNFWTCSPATHVERVLGCWWIVLDRQLNKLSEQVQTVQSLHPYQPIAPLERVDVQCILGTKTVPTWFAGTFPIYRGFWILPAILYWMSPEGITMYQPISHSDSEKIYIHEISPLYSHYSTIISPHFLPKSPAECPACRGLGRSVQSRGGHQGINLAQGSAWRGYPCRRGCPLGWYLQCVYIYTV